MAVWAKTLGGNKSPITLKPTTTMELEGVSKTVAFGHAAGYDNIPVRVIKSSFKLNFVTFNE